MSIQGNSKPSTPPVIVVKEPYSSAKNMIRLIPAAIGSAVFHAGLILLLLVILKDPQAAPAMESVKDEATVNADPAEQKPSNDPFLTTDIDPAAQEFDTDIQYNVDRKADVSVPGMVNPNEAVGILDAPKDAPPVNLPAPGGIGAKGQGGTIEGAFNTSNAVGMLGGYGPRGLPLAGTFYGRSGATREFALRDGGGTKESEAAVTRGLKWLCRMQQSDGKWMLDDSRFKDKGGANDIAGTAFGLLPLLGAGKTHKAKDAPYDKPVEKALLYLIKKQDRRTGNFGGGMYAHGLASIAICEAYGLSQDPNLRRPAQMAINFIVQAQHDGGGWRYSPNQAGDTSVVGWQVMALKSAQMAGLDVPEVTMKKAVAFMESACGGSDEGYAYVPGGGSTPTMSAVGLLCRQYLQSWGPQNLRMIKGVENHIKKTGPLAKHMYFSYYATQVMHHFGGESWKSWNEKMREDLLKLQDKGNGPMDGSWSSQGDPHGNSGGRLMQTSLTLLTLEVYYRHLPLYYRDPGDKKMAAK
ncbi:MAG: terpene cyclase/mutase family protein [Gemmataceae bacterium]|nr:terpene cyclase/mutase family protein [Gemmataceae bacterium]MCI0738785.1 terpene cyclase/mutase family protein [Gemmataceae bacterium]